jgi:glyoxylase-like metal-dependent hydrolase (beta-lactamase superfamily II)
LLETNQIKFGKNQFKILQVPGHSPGHVAFYHEESNQIWGGDVLFRQSIGRTDLPGGDFEQLKNSIEVNLFTLPEETTVLPGHGPTTTIGFERLNNPFVKVTV